MQHRIEQLDTELKGVTLSADEKAGMKRDLIIFMYDHPAHVIRSPFAISLASLHTLRAAMGALLVVVLIGGSIATAAERSLPGDMLYGLKVNVNEEVRSAVTLSSESEAAWEVQRASRRLREAEKLATLGRLDVDTLATLEARFEKHAEASALEAEKSDDAVVKAAVHADIEATFEAHDAVIRTLIESDDTLEEGLEGVRLVVAEHAEEAEDARRAAENELSDATEDALMSLKLRARDIQDDAEDQIDEVEDSFTSAKWKIDPLFADEIEDRLDDAVEIVRDGKRALKDDMVSDALIAFQDAIREAREADVFLSAAIALIPEETEPEVDGSATTTPDAATTTELTEPLPITVPGDILPVEPLIPTDPVL